MQCIMLQCAQRMYSLKLLKHDQCMPPDKHSILAHSLIVSRILHALPSLGSFLSADLNVESLERLMHIAEASKEMSAYTT